jgi:acyl-CoA synthetase (AMP-forming)/AMP-acid ligase II/acyl carrier protein
MSSSAALLGDIVRRKADLDPDAVALLAPGRAPMSFGTLAAQLDGVASRLKEAGIGPGDRIAVALPNGPDTAAVFLGVTSVCACAPLNPANLAELEFTLRDGKATALLLQKDSLPVAREVAARLGLRVFDLVAQPNPGAGSLAFDLDCAPQAGAAAANSALSSSAVTLLLHTSGTTARPKLVPLTSANILASARQVAATYELGPADRCLNIMPLFHIHGLVAGIIAPLVAGGSVVCPPSFAPDAFFDWLRDFAPTWYTAVPTMHQAILAAIDAHREIVDHHRLRFIRSCSAALPPAVMSRLESCFRIPVLEAYGMTEAAHQIASARLPPYPRHSGSVGLASGVEIAVRDEGGRILTPPASGEVIVRGPSLTAGYEDNSAANEAAFVDGWFRTGDVGRLEADGTLWLTARLKEIINRGGEKVAPLEIDQALLTHPAVAEAAAFAVPHESLGEEVAAAVVLRPGATATEAELKAQVARQLSPYKVPRRIVVCTSLPKSPTGKLRRGELAVALGLATAMENAHAQPASTPLEATLAAIWARTLGLAQCGVEENFFLLGGDSLKAIGLIAEISETLNVDLPIESIFDAASTIRGMAALIGVQRPRAVGDRPVPLPEPRPATVAASFAQESFWVVSRLHRGTPLFNMTTVVELRGVLDQSALGEALRKTIARHEALRTVVKQQDRRIVQSILPPFTPSLEVESVDGDSGATAALQALAQEPFDLATGPLFRARLVRSAADRHLLLMTLHHAIADGWSRAMLVRDIAALYGAVLRGGDTGLPPLRMHYADFAVWQRRRHEAGGLEAHLEFWRDRLAGVSRFALEPDHPRPSVADWHGACAIMRVDQELARSLRGVARSRRVTLFMLLLAAFAVVLHEDSGARDLVVAIPVANRPSREFEHSIGSFVNLLPLHLVVDGDPRFSDLLAAIRDATAATLAHQDAPIELILGEWPSNSRSRGDAAIPVQFQLRNFGNAERIMEGDLAVAEAELDSGIAHTDLSVEISEAAGALICRITYRTDLFLAERIANLAGRFAQILTAAADSTTRRLSEF